MYDRVGGEGGCIAIDRLSNIGVYFNVEGMAWSSCQSGVLRHGIYGNEIITKPVWCSQEFVTTVYAENNINWTTENNTLGYSGSVIISRYYLKQLHENRIWIFGLSEFSKHTVSSTIWYDAIYINLWKLSSLLEVRLYLTARSVIFVR